MKPIEVLLSVALSAAVGQAIVGAGLFQADPDVSDYNYFVCDGNHHLDMEQACDGFVDCLDKSDERQCTYDACSLPKSRKFTCKTGLQCILEEFRCDGVLDCRDQSDELNCTQPMFCPSEFFACTDGSGCIPRNFQCDGHSDCIDKSDEFDDVCHGVLHGYWNCKDRFKCGFGSCLRDERFICDGKDHCPDGRDESSETCLAHTDCRKCTQRCLRHSHGASCTCNNGFEIAEDAVTCRDIDECALGLCSQNCKNTEGSFTCSCRPGFMLINGTKCENENKATLVWYLSDESTNGQIILERNGAMRKYRIPLISTQFHFSLGFLTPMRVDIENELFYMVQGNSLYRMDLKTPQPTLDRVLHSHAETAFFAVDIATQNIYFVNSYTRSISVCQLEGACMPLIASRKEHISLLQIARLENGTKLYWKEGRTIMSSSLDGTEIRILFAVLGQEKIRNFVIDEQSHKMYVALSNLLEVDLFSMRTKLLAKLDFNEHFLWNMVVHDDTVLIQVQAQRLTPEGNGSRNRIIKIDRQTGDHIGWLDTAAGYHLHSVQRTPTQRLKNVCWNFPCSHLCLPGTAPAAFKCLCPPGMHLDEENDRDCVMQEGEERIFFVNGSTLLTYVFENGQLYHNENFDLGVQPLAIASNLDMNLIYSTHEGLFALNKDGSRREYGSGLREIRAMTVDPTDDVLYAANDLDLLAINLKTSAVALISNDADIIHMDIDPLKRVIYIETQDSELHSLEIGTWDRVALDRNPYPSQHSQRNWAFDVFEDTIQIQNSLVIGDGYCAIDHYDEAGFSCHHHARGVWRGFHHSEHGVQLLARAGPPLAPSKGTACDSKTCDFCVSAVGANLLKPVCICPYGHDLGADGVSCSKKCAPKMLRCSSIDQCIHESRRCDGHDDCYDGSDEQNCLAHDCGDNFKCESTGKCISKKFVCDGQNDCPDRSDEAKCSARNCTAVQFTCEDGMCISMSKRCDRIQDCFHGDDEINCPKVVCKPEQFDCGSNWCISKDWVCDKRRDCPNGEDEVNCTSLMATVGKLRPIGCDPNRNFCCGSGETLSLEMHCNGEPECEDHSDEKDCPSRCTAPKFLCDTGACLQESDVCNGIPNCADGADERNCTGKCRDKGLFECRADGTCIAEAKLCDKVKDCSDGSDEAKAKCPIEPPLKTSCFADEFRCHNGQCIFLGQVCDNVTHCLDGSDEGEHCQNLDCSKAGCSHTCFADGPHQVRCSCPKGYRLMDNGYSCDDINECIENPEFCSQYCENTKGNYSCSCATGFTMNARGECRVESGDPVVFVAENGIVEAITNRNRLLILDSSDSRLGGIEYDVERRHVFVSDTSKNIIHRIPFDHSDPQNKREAYTQVKPGVLALDWVTGNLYFADFRPSIHVCDRGQARTNCMVLTEVNVKESPEDPRPSITSIALVPDGGIMFYSEGSTGFIFRQNMDGTDKRTFGWSVREKRPLSLTVDHIHRTLYWVDARSGSIESSDFKGERIRRIASHLDYVRSIAIFEDFLLFPEPEQEHWVIMHKQSGNIKSSKFSTLGSAGKIKIMHQVNQPKEINRCLKAKCQQLCLLKPHGFTCACTDGQELSSDNITCVRSTMDHSGLFDEKWQRQQESECSCVNGGKCYASKMANRGFYCKCPPGYRGDQCEYGPTRNLVGTVVLICTLSMLVAGAGVLLMILVARRDRFGKGVSNHIPEGSDRLNLINEDAEGGPLY